MKMLEKNLDGIKKYIKGDRDFIIVVDGSEGKGKSTLALQGANYFENGNFDVRRVAFTETDVYRTLWEIKKYQSFIIDEGENILLSRDTMRRPNKEMIKTIMSITRKKNVLIWINIPDFLMLDKYIKYKRVGMWIHVIRRGIFKVFGAQKARMYAQIADKTSSRKKIRLPEPDFIDIFDKFNSSLWEEYEKRKIKKGEEDIQKKLLLAERTENETTTLYEAALFLGIREERILDMIKLKKLTAEIDEYGQYKIPLREINRLKDEIKEIKHEWEKYEIYKKEKQV